MRYIVVPPSIRSEHHFFESVENHDGTIQKVRRNIELSFKDYLLLVVLQEPAWRAGSNEQAASSLTIKLDIEKKVLALVKDGDILELTDLEWQLLGDQARAGTVTLSGGMAVLNLAFDGFRLAIVTATTTPMSSEPNA